MTLEDNRTQLLVAVGECLHVWGFVEIEVSNLYTILHGIKRDDFAHPIRAAFEAVISLEVRLAMLRAYVTADALLAADYLPHVELLIARIFKLYKKRHEVAHFVVVQRDRNNGRELFIRPFFTWNAFNQQRGTELNQKQILERMQAFADLSARIRRHIQHVGALRDLPPEFYVRAGDIAYPPLGAEDLIPEESARQLTPTRE